ncbi:MAG: hypothetical protein JF589_16680 [Gemmatimonadetes bacterium]|nr:hypothetical protein [Gemmatimonadota bacterium]
MRPAALLCAALLGAAPLGAQRDTPAAAPRAAAPSLVPATGPSLVEGRVVRPAPTGEVGVPGVWVTIHRVGPDSAGPLDSMRTERYGGYHFTYRRFGDPTALYFAASVYAGIAYFSAPFRAGAVRGDDAEIVVFDTTTGPVKFTVQGHHLVIGAPRPTGLRDIVEVYEISNDTVVTAIGRDSLTPVWSAPLPKGATNFVAGQGDVSASSIQRRGDSVVLLAPFSPGVKQLSFSYALDARAFPLDITLDRQNGLLEVLLEEPGAQVRAPSLRAQGNATTQGRTFKRFLAQNPAAGERVRIDVPSTAFAARSTLVTAVAVGIALAMVAALWVAYRRGRAARPAAAPAQPEESVATLASAIAALDARRDAHDPSLSSADYDAERAALKARLAAKLADGTSPA